MPAGGSENLPRVSVSVEVERLKVLGAIWPLGAHHPVGERRKQPLGPVVTPHITESDDRYKTGVARHLSQIGELVDRQRIFVRSLIEIANRPVHPIVGTSTRDDQSRPTDA